MLLSKGRWWSGLWFKIFYLRKSKFRTRAPILSLWEGGHAFWYCTLCPEHNWVHGLRPAVVYISEISSKILWKEPKYPLLIHPASLVNLIIQGSVSLAITQKQLCQLQLIQYLDWKIVGVHAVSAEPWAQVKSEITKRVILCQGLNLSDYQFYG